VVYRVGEIEVEAPRVNRRREEDEKSRLLDRMIDDVVPVRLRFARERREPVDDDASAIRSPTRTAAATMSAVVQSRIVLPENVWSEKSILEPFDLSLTIENADLGSRASRPASRAGCGGPNASLTRTRTNAKSSGRFGSTPYRILPWSAVTSSITVRGRSRRRARLPNRGGAACGRPRPSRISLEMTVGNVPL